MGILLGGSDTVTIYESDVEFGTDLNVLPKTCTLVVGPTRCNIHRGGRQAEDAALAIGMDAPLAALGYFEPSMAGKLNTGRVLLDQNGDCWVIRGRPSVRGRFEATAHARVLLQFLIVRPNGL